MSAKRLAILLVWFLIAALGFSQSSNLGAIFGTVRDQSGAVVPGASISATNLETGVSRKTVSNSAGEYRFPFLAPGRYTVTGNLKGFRKTTVTNLSLTVGQALRTDLKMQVGATTQTVTVASTATPLNLETASRGDVITQKAISNLPLNGREWIQLATIVPGSQSGNVKRGTYTDKGVEVSFNGARDTYNSYYVDGADSTDAYHNTLISSPALDAIKEFRVETNMYSAQYGRGGGAVITAVTKSGTNNYHGSLYEYLRNKALDARPPFFTAPKSQEPGYLFNQFGGSVGGPIKKNKAFFFFSMEKFREKTPGSLMVSFAPTAAEAQGDVSNTINPFSGKPVVLTNPNTGAVIPSGILPASLISPVGKTLMGIWSQYKPNYNDPFLNLHIFRGSSDSQNKYMPRIDLNLNASNVIFGSLDWDDYNNGTAGNTPYGDKIYKEHDQTMAFTYTHIFSPTLINDFNISHTWYLEGSQFALRDQSYGVKWGFYKPLNEGLGSPRVLMYTQGYKIFTIGGDGDLYHKQRTTFLHDNLAWVKGRHTVYFGGSFRRENFDWTYDSGNTQDYFGLLDGLPGYGSIYGETGSTFTDLLTAMPNLMTVGAGGGGLMPFSRNAFAGFVQDDWKVSSRLTLNLGLRYDFEAPFSIDNHQFLGLDINTGVPRYCAGAPKNLLAIMRFNYEVGGPCRDHNPDYRDFSPRIGFALRPFDNNKTVLRGGYGIFYTSENAFNTTYGGWVQPFGGIFRVHPGSYFWNPNINPGNPLFDGQSHFVPLNQEPYGLQYEQGTSMGYFLPTTPNYPTAYVEQYNVTLGRDIGLGTILNIGWVGSRGVNLNGDSTLYNYSPALLAKYQAANPGLANVGLRTKGFNSYYNALQVDLRRQLAHGVYFIASYDWGHALTDMSSDDTNETLFTDTTAAGNIVTRRMANADYNVPQRFIFSAIWKLPFGRGQKFGSNWSPALDTALGGWQLASIITMQDGVPFTVYTTSLKFPDRVCSGILPKSQRSATHWFNYSCFVTHKPTTITNPVTGQPEIVNTQGNAAPNSVYGPGQNNWDLSTDKDFKIGERFNLQLRGEFFNAFNHLNLQAPGGNYFFNTSSGAAITRAANNRDIQIALRLTF